MPPHGRAAAPRTHSNVPYGTVPCAKPDRAAGQSIRQAKPSKIPATRCHATRPRPAMLTCHAHAGVACRWGVSQACHCPCIRPHAVQMRRAAG
eukprot:42307-Chlamydomonas_euryale.AAC.4